MPSLQQLRYLVALADTLNFHRAAQAVHVTQPTLSSGLKEMEARLGVQLVERTRARVLMTPIGSEVTERARRVLRDVQEIRDLATRGQVPLGGTIKVGVVHSLGSYLLPLLLPDLHESHPQMRLYIREDLSHILLQKLDTGELDLLFHPLPIGRGDLQTLPIFDEPLLVAASRDHPLAARDAIRRGDLKGETFLTLEPGHQLNDQVRALCESFNARLSLDYEGTSLDTLRQMVAMGMGLSLLPALYVRSEVLRERLVTAVPFAVDPPSRRIGMIWRRSSHRDQEFRDLAEITAGLLQVRAPEVTVL